MKKILLAMLLISTVLFAGNPASKPVVRLQMGNPNIKFEKDLEKMKLLQYIQEGQKTIVYATYPDQRIVNNIITLLEYYNYTLINAVAYGDSITGASNLIMLIFQYQGGE